MCGAAPVRVLGAAFDDPLDDPLDNDPMMLDTLDLNEASDGSLANTRTPGPRVRCQGPVPQRRPSLRPRFVGGGKP